MSPARTVRIAPSLLAADLGRLREELAAIEAGGADWLHFDVMDGVFVPNLTFGAKLIETCRALTRLPIDVHLMTVEPEKYFDSFVKAGANVLTIHVETAPHLNRQIGRIKELGCSAGAVMNPGTPVESVAEVAADLDLLLIMSVNPGFGGQKFIPASVDKIRRARAILDATRSRAALEVDGGISRDTINACWRAGADTFVAGVAVFQAKDPAAEIAALRALCAEAV
ncbi:MAG: ribulose-phosphate 3-epimerase [Gemmatimonadetes bacterium]|nr:ribulose-phosphate 3-epimerase [Gemmatimonadota bacterium]MBI3567742.1 ribulose-phosphate 3-epimerase [Gemmatimonadota bacterium]